MRRMGSGSRIAPDTYPDTPDWIPCPRPPVDADGARGSFNEPWNVWCTLREGSRDQGRRGAHRPRAPGRSACGSSATASRPRAARRPATASTRTTTSSCCGARSSLRERGLSVPAALDRARDAGARPTGRRSTARSPAADVAGHAAGAAQADADRDLARDRGRDDRPRRRPGGVRRVPARAQLPRRASTATGGWRSVPTPPWCSPTSRCRGVDDGAGRDPDRARRGARQRVGGDRRRARLRRLPARVGAPADAGGGARAARARPALRVALDDGSRDRAAGGARRLRARRARRRRSSRRGSSGCSRTGRWRSRRRRPG